MTLEIDTAPADDTSDTTDLRVREDGQPTRFFVRPVHFFDRTDPAARVELREDGADKPIAVVASRAAALEVLGRRLEIVERARAAAGFPPAKDPA